MILLFACAGPDRVVHVAAELPPPPPVQEEAPPPPPPPGWRTGHHDAPALLRAPVEAWSRVLAGPIVEPVSTDGERIYAVAEGRVYCFDLAGAKLWDIRVRASGGVAITDQGPVVGTEGGQVLILDPANGATVRATVGGGAVRGTPVQLPTSVAWVTVHGLLSSTANWGQEVALSAAGSVAADEDTLFLATLEGSVIAATSSGTLWRATLPAPAIEGVALDAERVFVPLAATGGAPGGVLALDREGHELWRRQTLFQPSAALGVGGSAHRPLLLVPDKDGHLYALDPGTGAEVWAVEGFGEFGTQPATVDSQIYAGNADGSMVRIDADGGVVWSVQLGSPPTGDPAFANGKLFVGLANGRLVALEEPR